MLFFFFQAEDGIRDLVRSRGLGDVYKRQMYGLAGKALAARVDEVLAQIGLTGRAKERVKTYSCLLYTSPSPRDRTRSRMPSSA